MTAFLGGIRHGSLHSLHIHHLLNSWTCYYISFDKWIVIIGVLIVETIVLYVLVELVNAHYSSYRLDSFVLDNTIGLDIYKFHLLLKSSSILMIILLFVDLYLLLVDRLLEIFRIDVVC